MKRLFCFAAMLSLMTAFIFAADFTEYKLSNGIPVYTQKNTVNKIDSVCIVVKGGVHYYEKQYSGLESALFTMMTKGSARYSFEDIMDMNYETRTGFKSATSYEGSWLSLTSIDEYLMDTLPVLLNGFTNPAYNDSEFNKLKTDYSDQIQSMLNDPVDMANYYAKQFIYRNHAYETSPSVTPESLNNITVAAMKNLHSQIMDSRRISVVAITNADPSEYLPLLEKELGSIGKGSWSLEKTAEPLTTVKKRPLVLTHAAAQGTGYYYRAFVAPSITSEDYTSFLIARKIYDQTMHNVLRVKYGMCYVAGNSDLGFIPNVGFEVLYRCNDMTDIKERVKEARDITASGKYIVDVDKKGNYIFADIASGFEGFKNTQINALYGNYVTTRGIAGLISESILLLDDAEGLEKLFNQIETVTSSRVIEVFNKYYVTDDEFWFACVAPECEEDVEDALN